MTLKDDLAASTPGPWGTILLDTDLHLEKAAGRSIIRRNYFFGHAVVQPYDRGKRPAICLVPMADADHMADARLIARAPDMAAALIEAEEALDALTKQVSFLAIKHPQQNDQRQAARAALTRIREVMG